MVLSLWLDTATPLTSMESIYGGLIGGLARLNYGRISDPQIDSLFAQGGAE
jgi:hypothetical protein